MRLYQLHSRQSFPISPEKAWNFLSNPENLSDITPARMGFEILSGGGTSMFPGQIIHYRVSPFLGYTTSWVTEITHVKDGIYFVDEQRFGPYALWHHKHFLKPIDGGVTMEDIIDYKLPFGALGQLAHILFVKKQLKQIFSYRGKRLLRLFGKIDHDSHTLNFQ